MNTHIEQKVGFKNYQPLIIIISLIILVSIVLQVASGDFNIHLLMNHFMGLFFVIFSMFKLINIGGFYKGFRMYDILAKHYAWYGYCYPFVELALGLAYLSNVFPAATNIITLAIMTVSSVGVIKSIKSGMNLKCACLGC